MSPLDKLTHELSKLPGIGGKTALRLAMFIMRQDSAYARSLSQSLLEVVDKVRFCTSCFHFTHQEPCSLCANAERNKSILCVVEESSDLMAIERTHSFKGLYHVLQGALSPLDGIGPDDLRIRELIERIHKNQVQEIILATNANVTGDATALYISRLVKPLGIKITRLAYGIPVGSQIEYVDQMTLTKALETRRDY